MESFGEETESWGLGAGKGCPNHPLISRSRYPFSLTLPLLIPYGMASHQLQLAAQALFASFRKHWQVFIWPPATLIAS